METPDLTDKERDRRRKIGEAHKGRRKPTLEEMTPEQREREMERRRKIGSANRGRPRPDLAERNRTPEMRSLVRTVSDEARQRLSAERTVHGHARKRGEGREGTPTYYSWASMVQRCTNPTFKDWPLYGGRGISVCTRWLESFAAFLADMGERPAGMTLDRIDVNGNYEPGNCRWATATEQGRNTRTNRLITFNGETRCLSEWAEITGLRQKVIATRLERGWTVGEALTRPVKRAS